MGQILSMRNPIQHYAWGTRDTLARLRGAEFPTAEPEAELWVGAHPSSPSVVTTEQGEKPLSELVAEDPRAVLPEGVEDFPFLFKILAIDSPLSLQVHPSDAQAEAGFEREEAAGVPREAAHRNYKDRGSKPETVIAVSRVRILTGIRPQAQLERIAEAFGLRWLADLAHLDAAQLITAVFAADDASAARDLNLTVTAARDWLAAHPFDASAAREDEDPAGLAALADLIGLLDEKYPGDRGILVATAMNQVFLEPGESAYTPDGQVHAYIHGTAVEIMNASDNVMRAGLTPKHIDVEEMLSVLVPDQPAPEIELPEELAPGVHRYGLWRPELSVTRIDVAPDAPVDYELEGLAAVLCTDGEVSVEGAGRTVVLRGADSVLHTGTPDAVRLTGSGRLYVAARAD